MTLRTLVVCGLLGAGLLSARIEQPLSAQLDRLFFNPTIGQKVKITLANAPAEAVQVEIVDRDGYAIRSLEAEAAGGKLTLDWDGRDRSGSIVPDEAYSLRIRTARSGSVVYD
ncbi:MAG: FlgD immunoglobulin-like domain containing protein, partial [Candidatus Binatia bacterium]